MKKIVWFSALLSSFLAIGLISEKISFARVTSSADDRDAFCAGPSGAEACIDSSGNIIPTTDDDTDLGTSSLQWQDIYSDGTIYADAISNEGAYSGTTVSGTAGYFSTIVYSTAIAPGSKTIAEIGATTATYVGQFYYCSDCSDDLVCIATGTASDHQWCGNNGARATCS